MAIRIDPIPHPRLKARLFRFVVRRVHPRANPLVLLPEWVQIYDEVLEDFEARQRFDHDTPRKVSHSRPTRQRQPAIDDQSARATHQTAAGVAKSQRRVLIFLQSQEDAEQRAVVRRGNFVRLKPRRRRTRGVVAKNLETQPPFPTGLR